MFFDKVKKFFGNDDKEKPESVEDEYYEVEATMAELSAKGQKMVLLEPRAFSESQQIADHLKGRRSVVVNLKRVTPEQGKRIVDFLSGTVYAIGGDIQKLGGGIFLCTPRNVGVEGEITDTDEAENGIEDIEIEW